MTEILPTNFKPINYGLYFKPEPLQERFIGKTTIELECVEETDKIVLNGNGFTDMKIVVKDIANNKEVELQMSEDKEKEQMTFTGYSFTKGKYELTIDYIGILKEGELNGYYQSTYELEGQKKIICTTQFEAPCARKAFPCFDEPIYKATFDITLEVPKHEKCFSNMPEKTVVEKEETKVVTFERSVKMSTYLVCFINGEFESYYDETSTGIKLGLHFPKNHKNISRFALETMKRCLELYEKAYDLKFPLPKCDWVAVPDFDAGAMENWGLITSRETEVCLQENASFTSFKRSASVVCHELAHMWFGNLVTMKWWNDLWLNEGFASYMGDLFAVATLFPEWKMEVSNVFESFLYALDFDGCESTHPISVPVNKASEINELFDLISYDKGCALIAMMINFVGVEKFMQGISKYLKEYAYGNAVSDEMWRIVGEHAGIDLKDIVQAWTYEAGCPLVTLELKDGKLTLTQERCGCESDQVWKIPMILSCGEYVQPYLFKEKTTTIEWKHPYVIGNTKATGFYRTRYTSEMLEVLQKQEIGIMELMVIIDDLYTLAKMGKSETKDLLSFLTSVKPFTPETYQLSRVVISCIGGLKGTFKDPKVEEFVNQQKERLLKPAFDTLGMTVVEGEPVENGRLRATCMMNLENDELIAYAKSIVNENKISTCPGEMRAPMMILAGRYADAELFEKFKDMYLNGETAEIKRLAIQSLGSVKDEELFKSLIEFTKTKVRPQDIGFMMVIANRHKCDAYANWVFSNFKEIDEKYVVGSFSTRNWIIESLILRNSTREMYDKMKQYFTENTFESSQNTVNQSLEKLMMRIEWIERDMKGILEFIEKK